MSPWIPALWTAHCVMQMLWYRDILSYKYPAATFRVGAESDRNDQSADRQSVTNSKCLRRNFHL